MRFLLFVITVSMLLASTEAFAQTVATFAENQIGTPCARGAHSTDFDTLAQCTSTGATSDYFRKAPLFVGAVTSPPYSSTACDANKAGMVQYTGSALAYCNGTAWTNVAMGSSSGMVGDLKIWPTPTVPSGYLECNGAAVSRVTYAALFALLGTTYGAGDGSTTFNLPDYRGMFLRGWAHGSATDPDAASRTNRGDSTTGDNVGTKQADAIKTHTNSIDPPSTGTSTDGSHSHGKQVLYSQSNQAYLSSNASSPTNSASTTSDGSHSHSVDIAAFNSTYTGGNETRPVNIYVMYIVKY